MTTGENGKPATGRAPFPPTELLLGISPAMAPLRAAVERIAAMEVPVLIQGESGAGKEALARWLHLHSPRAGGPFVKVHCPAIPDALLESELLGHEAGAFTGAVCAQPGRAEEAEGGTLLLDEIADLHAALQAKLLHLLQDGVVSRVGGGEPRALDVRMICATQRDLEEEMRTGRFRADLFYRINVVGVKLPPLRERSEDVPRLAEYFVRLYAAQHGRAAAPLSGATLQLLAAHRWPGNVRELENLIHRYVIFGSEAAIAAELLEPPAAEAAATPSLRRVARQAALEAQRRVILQVLHAQQWNRKRTARALNISYRSLLYKLRDTGIPSRHGAPRAPRPVLATNGARS